MPTPQDQGSGLSEASRLLQEGLQLLDERAHEVDALVQQAEERARQLTAEAEQRAQEITAEAERRQAELQEQIAALRAEIGFAREELARIEASPRRGGRGNPRPVPVAVAPVATSDPSTATPAAAAEATSPESGSPAEPGAAVALEAAEVKEESEAAGTPRWGRRSSIAAARQAIRKGSSRPRWLPRWLPFLLLLAVGAGVVMANAGSQGDARGPTLEPSPRDANQVGLTSMAPGVATTGSGLGVAAATSLATSLAVAVTSLSLPTLTEPPTRAPTGATNGRLTAAPRLTATPRLSPTPAPTRQPIAVPQQRAPLVAPTDAPPAEVGPDGPVVAAYTTYSTYSVRRGDTLNRLATRFGVSAESIIRASGLKDPNLLLVGQVLTIPRDAGWLYRVQPNETLELIALRFGTSVDDLVASSMLSSAEVQSGDLVFIPNRALQQLPKQ